MGVSLVVGRGSIRASDSLRTAAGWGVNRKLAGRAKATEPLGDRLHPQFFEVSETDGWRALAQQGQTGPLQQVFACLFERDGEAAAGMQRDAAQRTQLNKTSSLRAI
jgi:hypothetical protein